jgi:hypothetical protein
MALPESQNVLDWVTQLWNIALGRKVDADEDHWLLGPIGDIGGIADKFIARVAEEENLTIKRNEPASGLIDGFEGLAKPVNPDIEAFYKRTIDLDAWTQWKPIFGSLGYIVYKLFSQRIQQLNLPQNSLDTALGIKSEIISLVDDNEKTVYRVWYRRLKKTDEVVYSGIYTHCRIPSGEHCLKVIFPLPQGSATVIMRMSCDSKGNLELESKGKKYGDPGFYFLVKDRKGNLWKHYLPSFHERIFVYQDDEGTLRADHSMSLWKCRAYDLHYKMTEKENNKGE